VTSELRIVPEPPPDEREAIAKALEAVGAPPPAHGSAWRRSGLPASEDDLRLEPEPAERDASA
jgi:hypothetical protein